MRAPYLQVRRTGAVLTSRLACDSANESHRLNFTAKPKNERARADKRGPQKSSFSLPGDQLGHVFPRSAAGRGRYSKPRRLMPRLAFQTCHLILECQFFLLQAANFEVIGPRSCHLFSYPALEQPVLL